MTLAAQVREKLPGASYEEKRRILDMLDVQIASYYGYDKDRHIGINCQIPTPTNHFPHNQESGNDIFIVSQTSLNMGHNITGIQLMTSVPSNK